MDFMADFYDLMTLGEYSRECSKLPQMEQEGEDEQIVKILIRIRMVRLKAFTIFLAYVVFVYILISHNL